MRRAARLLSMCAALVAGLPLFAHTQTPPAATWNDEPRPPVGEQLPGMPSRFWVQLIGGSGRLPDQERLVVLATDGRVLGVVEGNQDAVRFPELVDVLLDDGGTRVVLAHNHPAGTSLSGADLALLGRRGVDRVVAVGNDGSVYEATAGPRFVRATTVARLFPQVEAHVRERLPFEAARAGVPPGAGFEFFSHVVASAFARAGAIHYRSQMSPSVMARYLPDAAWLDRLVSDEASRLAAQLPR